MTFCTVCGCREPNNRCCRCYRNAQDPRPRFELLPLPEWHHGLFVCDHLNEAVVFVPHQAFRRRMLLDGSGWYLPIETGP